jgi:signal transduction histidine kinase
VFIWTAPILDAEGNISQVMEMSTDITQIRRLQDHLSSLGLLIGTVSHGIKGLLTGLDGGVYLLDSGVTKNNHEEIVEGWETVKLMTDRIRSMVLNILYYAKERDLKWEQVDVLSFANEIAATIEPKVLGKDIEFVREFDASLGAFEVDASVLRSALINILENAVEACTEDRVKKAHKIVFRVSQDPDTIVFDVSDNGVGMDQETRENMFTLFFSSKGHKGTGLGLFISNQIVKQHGGSIQVDSLPGEGARFRVVMPKKCSADTKEARQKDDVGLRPASM